MNRLTENLFSSRILRKVTVATLCLAFFSSMIIFIAASCEKPDDTKKADEQTNPEPVKKEDVRIGWSLDGKDGDAYVENALNLERINELKKLPTTGDIIAYVYNRNGCGPPKDFFPIVIAYLDNIKNAGVKFQPDTIYVDDFFKADSIAAQQKFALTMDLWSRRK
jgi:hypothetical protein